MREPVKGTTTAQGPDGKAPEKSDAAFRTISEVAEALDTPAHVLRFWESKFAQIKPMKRGGGRRYYRPEDVSLLRGIRELLYEDGLTIKGVQKVLRERGQRHVAEIGGDCEAPGPAAGSGDADHAGPAGGDAASAPPLIPPQADMRATLARLETLRDRLRRT